MRFKVQMDISSESYTSAKALCEDIESILRRNWDWTHILEIKANQVVPLELKKK